MKVVSVHKFGLENPLVIEDLPESKAQSGQVLVRVRAAGVNPLEISIRSGGHPRSMQMQVPFVCGSDIAGEVESVGAGVKRIAPGDRVWGRSLTGGYAEKGVLLEVATGRLPDSLSFEEGACLPIPLLTAWNALVIKAGAGPGETVLVQGGAGGVGHMAIQLARHMGCRVLATASSNEKAEFCREAGAEEVIIYRESNVPDRVKEMTAGRGADVVVETAASENLVGDLELLALNGRIVVVGGGTGKGTDVTISLRPAMSRDAKIMGISSANMAPLIPRALLQLSSLLERGDIQPHIGHELPLDQANESHELVLSGKFLGKVVLKV